MAFFYAIGALLMVVFIGFCWWLLRDHRRQRKRTKELEERLKQFKGLHIEEEKLKEL